MSPSKVQKNLASVSLAAVGVLLAGCGGGSGSSPTPTPAPPAPTPTPALDCSAHGNAKAVADGHDMSGKVVLLTGSDTGIGYETALALAGVNATVVIANRNSTTGQDAVANITKLTGNNEVHAMQVDLSSLASVRSLASEVLGKYNVLDVVILDAGVSNPHGLTKDGFEFVMQVNYIGHFLLEQLLLPALRRSRAGKLIQVSSGEAFDPCSNRADQNCTDLDSIGNIVKSPTNISNYRLSKFMMLYNARELSVREAALGSKVRGYAIRPGFVDTPLVRKTTSPETMKKYCSWPACAAGFKNKSRHECEELCPMPEVAGAVSPTYVAVSDLASDMAGDLFFQCAAEDPPVWVDGNVKQKGLYDMSLAWVGLNYTNVIV